MKVKRKHAYALRNLLGEIEASIPKEDRSPIATRERDLMCMWAIAMWDLDWKKMISCMQRLAQLESPRKEKLELASDMFAAHFLQRA